MSDADAQKAKKVLRSSIHALSRAVVAVHVAEEPERSEPEIQLHTIFVFSWLTALTRESYSEPFNYLRTPHSELSACFKTVVNRLHTTVRKELPVYLSHSNEPVFS